MSEDRAKEIIAISIHAPTRGATNHSMNIKRKTFISIHAPTRGATNPLLTCLNIKHYFNPRSYKRSDTVILL